MTTDFGTGAGALFLCRPAGEAAAPVLFPRADVSARPVLRMTAMDLAADPASAGIARRRARAALAGWGLDGIADDVTVVVSELVTNAVAAARSAPGGARPVRMRLIALDGPGARVEVWDAGPGTPASAQAGTDDSSGRGLVIVAALSARWGSRAAACGGKLTWAEVRP